MTCELGICDGSGWVQVDHSTARKCDCRGLRAKRAASRRLGTGIPKRFRGVGFDRKPIADMDPGLIRAFQGWVRNLAKNLEEGRGLWLYGNVGTGKTSLAMLVAKEALAANRSVAIYSMPRLLAEIRETYDDASQRSYMELFKRLTSVDLLQIDDLGAEHRTEWVLEQLYSIVNERWQNQRSMIVTSNVVEVAKDDPEANERRHPRRPSPVHNQPRSPDWSTPISADRMIELAMDQIGYRTVSRLAEMCELIPVYGRDLRVSSTQAA